MGLKRAALLGFVLLCGLSSGCAGIITFDQPEKFKQMKLKEDPPESMALPSPGGPRPC